MDLNDAPTFKHCDDYIDDENQPKCLRSFLRYCRWPAHLQFRAERLGIKKPALFADWQRYKGKKKRVRVVMASRFGDVGITRDLKAESGYDWRVPVEMLSNFSKVGNVDIND
jgi:hypothetical protein